MTLLLGAVVSGAVVVVPEDPGELAGCAVAFTTTGEAAQAALDAGVEEVLAVSTAPLGGRLAAMPPLVLDAGRELPVHGDTWSGPLPAGWAVEVSGRTVRDLEPTGRSLHDVDLPAVGPADRVLTVLDPRSAVGLLVGLLGPLRAGSGLVLCPGLTPGPAGPDARQLEALLEQEGVTAVVGLDAPGLPRLDKLPRREGSG